MWVRLYGEEYSDGEFIVGVPNQINKLISIYQLQSLQHLQ